MLQKFVSRKFLVAIVSFVTVQVMPNLSAATQAKWSALIATAYLVAQGFADAFGSSRSGASQGDPSG